MFSRTHSVTISNLAWGTLSVTDECVLLYYFSGRALSLCKWHNMGGFILCHILFLRKKRDSFCLNVNWKSNNVIESFYIIYSSVKWGRQIDVQSIINGCKYVYTETWPNKRTCASLIVQLKSTCGIYIYLARHTATHSTCIA